MVSWQAPVSILRDVLRDVLARGWADLVARLDGPLHLRFVVQPIVAAILGIRAGLRDARAGEPPFLSAVLRERGRRRERLREALRDVTSVAFVAAVVDAAYQLGVHRGVFLGELVVTVVVLALVPYVLVRGPVARIARVALRVRSPSRGR
jgi:hypothetical protein